MTQTCTCFLKTHLYMCSWYLLLAFSNIKFFCWPLWQLPIIFPTLLSRDWRGRCFFIFQCYNRVSWSWLIHFACFPDTYCSHNSYFRKCQNWQQIMVNLNLQVYLFRNKSTVFKPCLVFVDFICLLKEIYICRSLI